MYHADNESTKDMELKSQVSYKTVGEKENL